MKRHETSMVSLTLGVVFLVVVAVWAITKTITVDLPSGGWFVAGGLIFLGVAGLAVAIRPARLEPDRQGHAHD
jgi:hypothetical protein